MLENLNDEDNNIIDRYAESIEREDRIISIPNNKYLERHILYFANTEYYYVQYSVYDTLGEKCYWVDGKKSKLKSEAEFYYESILNEVEGVVFK